MPARRQGSPRGGRFTVNEKVEFRSPIRINGRVSLKSIVNPVTDEVIVAATQIYTPEIARKDRANGAGGKSRFVRPMALRRTAPRCLAACLLRHGHGKTWNHGRGTGHGRRDHRRPIDRANRYPTHHADRSLGR